MMALYDSGSYHWSLFLGHISVEKILKALYTKLYKNHAPPIHNLYRLSKLCKIELSGEYADWFDTITSFNISARYDDYRREFYKICTREYTKIWTDKIMELRKWIKKML